MACQSDYPLVDVNLPRTDRSGVEAPIKILTLEYYSHPAQGHDPKIPLCSFMRVPWRYILGVYRGMPHAAGFDHTGAIACYQPVNATKHGDVGASQDLHS